MQNTAPTLIAVTKTHPISAIESAIENQIYNIGENKIQETEQKLKNYIKPSKMRLHLIGHLQSNKAKKACQLFDVIQTVDSLKLAKRLNTVSKESNQIQNIFLQVNIGNDPNKKGFTTKEIINSAREITSLNNLNLNGIMTILPFGIPENQIRLLYQKTREIRDEIKHSINRFCTFLSMGMSNDFEIAIEEGATHIRIGTSLFGGRNY